ncbi:MAG: endonuclease [Bacteroidaceae bacterium]|nr:endonuclease [Bacteroidaceae bacterium]
MKRTFITLLLAAVAVCSFAAAPNGTGTYYSAANGKKGAALKTALCSILFSSRFNPPLSYGDLWDAFYTTDVRDSDKVWDMYSNMTLTLGTNQDTGTGGNVEGQFYNREHSFPQSWFSSSTPMYTDLHHIYPTDKCVNGKRSNYPFGETNGEDYKSNGSFSKLGACTYPGYNGTVFEPNDIYKGDFARTYFYMVTCYEEQLSSWVSSYGGTTDVDEVLDGNTYPGLTTWQKNMLLEWAAADPVSQKEIDRNNAVYTLQGNRNPFIDYPGLEQYIWGTKTDVAFDYDDYDGSGSGTGGDPDPGTDPNPGSAGTYKLTITAADFNGNSYAGNNNEKTSLAVCTTDASKTYEVKWTSYQVMLQSSKMQWQKNAGYIYNSTDLGTINSVTVTSSAGTFTTYYGTSEQPSSSTTVGGGYFKTMVGNATGTSSQVEVVFTIAGETPPSPVTSDLALSASSLSFDLYNDNDAKTISYTTSSTGNVTVSGGTGFVTTSVNQSTKTITVTPVAKTTSAQTITVSQEADETYEAGEVTFTVTVDDSTPVSSSGDWVETPFASLTSSDIFVIVGTNSIGSYAMSNDRGTSNPPTAVAVTIADGKITSDVADNIKWNISGNATDGYTFYPNGSTTTWLYCNTTASSKENSNMRVGTGDRNKYIFNNNFLVTKDDYRERYVSVFNALDWRGYIDVTIAPTTTKFYKYVALPSQTISVGDTGYATMVADADLVVPNGVEVFAAQHTAGSAYVHLEPVTGGIPQGEAVVVKANEGTYNFLYATEPVSAIADNDLKAATSDITADGTQYCLASMTQGIGFYKVQAGITIRKGKAYLLLSSGNNVKEFYGFEDDDPTGINEELRSFSSMKSMKDEESSIYNLAGQRLSKPQRGLNIIGGRKVLR